MGIGFYALCMGGEVSVQWIVYTYWLMVIPLNLGPVTSPTEARKVDIRVTINESDGTHLSSVADECDRVDTARRRQVSTGSNASSVSSSSSLPAVPPDGGWGWAVVFASFIAHCIADGCAFSFGIFYMTLKDSFNESDAKTSLVGSIFAGGDAEGK